MKAITISQPFASLIAIGEKFVENRSWPTRYRGPLAIHAGKGTQYLTKGEVSAQGLSYGQVVAICKLQACVELDPLKDLFDRHLCGEAVSAPSGLDMSRVDAILNHEYTEGPWCWVLGDVEPLPSPMEAVGKQGLWNWE